LPAGFNWLLTVHKKALQINDLQGLKFRGAEGTRTPVQTSPPKAFYMLIPALIVGKQQEPDKPIVSLAGWS